MGAAKGNKNAVGHNGKNAGRKSAYQEKADAALLYRMFFDPQNRAEIRALLATGKYSLKDVFISKGFSGNEKVLMALFNKLFPDKLIHSGKVDFDSSKYVQE